MKTHFIIVTWDKYKGEGIKVACGARNIMRSTTIKYNVNCRRCEKTTKYKDGVYV